MLHASVKNKRKYIYICRNEAIVYCSDSVNPNEKTMCQTMRPPRCSSAVLQTSQYEVAASHAVESQLLTAVFESRTTILFCSARWQQSKKSRTDPNLVMADANYSVES